MTERDGLAVIARCDGCEKPIGDGYRVETATYRDGKPPTYSAVVWLCKACHDQPRGAVEEVERLRAGIQWARGMCSDGESDTEIDAYLGSLLNEPGGRFA